MSDNMDQPTWADDHPERAPRCSGGCGKPVTHEGKICPSCWLESTVDLEPEEPPCLCNGTGQFPCTRPHPVLVSDPIQTPPTSDFALRMDIHNASFRLCFGTKAERSEAIERLSHLINVIQHETHLKEK